MRLMKGMKEKRRKMIFTVIAAVFWLLVWQLVSMAVGKRVILPGPADVVKALCNLAVTADFWRTVLNSFLHIAVGFAAAVVAGIGLAIISHIVVPVGILLNPVMRLIKAVPVASFIILILLWIRSEDLPAVIVFLMVLPVIYINVLTGIGGTDAKLLEMAKVFGFSRRAKLKYIYIPAVMPHFASAISIGLGFGWKSGIAAEVIALSPGAIGRKLYDAKLYLTTDELFAWTVVIVVLSVISEKAVMMIVNRIRKVG